MVVDQHEADTQRCFFNFYISSIFFRPHNGVRAVASAPLHEVGTNLRPQQRGAQKTALSLSNAMSSSTEARHLSIASAPARATQPRCFLPKAKFQMTSGDAISASMLQKQGGQMVCRMGGQQVKVLRRTTLPEAEHDVVRLMISGACLCISTNARRLRVRTSCSSCVTS